MFVRRLQVPYPLTTATRLFMGRSWFAAAIVLHISPDFLRTQFMHNGGIEQFSKIKRRLQQELPDEIFNVVNGNTDSEWAFALFLSKVCHLRKFLLHMGALTVDLKAS